MTWLRQESVSQHGLLRFDLILCRNVLIHFNRTLRNKVLTRFREELRPGGFLCLGAKETLSHTSVGSDFAEVASPERLYRHQTVAAGYGRAASHDHLKFFPRRALATDIGELLQRISLTHGCG
ncbi:MAG: CheR family methyltransferase [Fuerstiella sp.]